VFYFKILKRERKSQFFFFLNFFFVFTFLHF
jgi:hypothetical protein